MQSRTVTANRITGKFYRSIEEHRKKLNATKPTTEPAKIPYKNFEIHLTNSNSIDISIYRPINLEPPYSTIFYIPGTAFVARETAFTENICSNIAEKSNCQVIVINHRLAPEDKFPQGLNDVYNIFKYIIKNPKNIFNIDPNRVAIVGYSSGGNFAASIAIYAKDENISISRQVLISPILDLSRSLRAYKEEFENKDNTISDSFVEWFLNLYLPVGINLKDPLLSPFWHKNKRLKGLAPTDIIVAEYDRCRSDSEAYYIKLINSGVEAYNIVVEGADHSFLWNNSKIADNIGLRIKQAFIISSPSKPFLSLYEKRFYKVMQQIDLYKSGINPRLGDNEIKMQDLTR